MNPATNTDIQTMYNNIKFYKSKLDRVMAIHNISRSLENKLFPQNVLQILFDLNDLDSVFFVYSICAHQNLSKDFISKNFHKLYYTNALLNNPNIPNDTKTYIRMFI